MKRFVMGAPLIAAMAVGACGDSTGIENGGTIGIRFAAASTAGAGTALSAADLDLVGSNGTLSITDVRMLVREFEVDRVDDDCDDDSSRNNRGSGDDGSSGDDGRGDDDDCEKFRAPPAFISLPLDGQGALVVEQEVPPGVYDELELEVKELDDDDDDDSLRDRQARELMVLVRQQFPEWPREASLRVEGVFTPVSGAARPFVAYFDAEIEIEMRLSPPLVIGENDSPIVTIDVAPAVWFLGSTGGVVDLSAFDFATTGRVAEFEIEIERGFVKTRFED